MQESSSDFNAMGTGPAKKKARLTISKKNWMIIIIVVVSALALITSYSVGYSRGKTYQKTVDDTKIKASSANGATMPEIIRNRWSIVGTVESVSSDSITVKNNKGLVQTAKVDNKTSITDKNAKKTTIGAVKKGSSVIVIGTKDDNSKYTATMVRIKT